MECSSLKNKGFPVILLIGFLLLFSCAECYASDLVEIIKLCRWPIVILILAIIFCRPLGSLINKIVQIVINWRKGTAEISAQGPESRFTWPAQIKNIKESEHSYKMERLLKEEKFNELEKECQEWKKKDKESTSPYIYLGRSFMKQGKDIEARTEFEKALVIKDDDAEVYYYLTRLHQSKGDLKGSVKYIEKAYALKEDDPRITLNLAYINYYLYKDINKSLEFVEKSYKDYKEGLFPFEIDLNVSIRQSFEYYLACRGKKDDFQRAFELDKSIHGKYDDFDNEEKSYVLDTRGYLRYRATQEGYDPREKFIDEDKDLLYSALSFLTDAVKLNPSDKQILENLLAALALYKIKTKAK